MHSWLVVAGWFMPCRFTGQGLCLAISNAGNSTRQFVRQKLDGKALHP
nr:MAG TPA: hypothetical protein [Caudoviricetes sp.]